MIRLILFLGLVAIVSVSQAQFGFQYDPNIPVYHGSDSLSRAWDGGLNHPQFGAIDIDFDGQDDLFIFDRSSNQIRVYLTKTDANGNPYYAYEHDGHKYFPPGIRFRAAIVDYDLDGRPDLFTYGVGGVKVYRNVGSATDGLQWEVAYDLLESIYTAGKSNLFVSSIDIPAFFDVDQDGDIDVLTFNIGGQRVEFHKNLSIENYGVPDSLEFVLEDACWGKFREGEFDNSVDLNVNDGPCAGNLPPIEDNTRDLRHVGSCLLALDLNSDQVTDLLLGDVEAANITALINGANTPSDEALMITADSNFPSNTTPVDLEVMPAGYHLDIDFDGVKDLLFATNAAGASENKNSVRAYKNVGTNQSPQFVFQPDGFLQQEMIDNGRGSIPIFVDLNGDGLMDLLIANNYRYKSFLQRSSQIQYYQNTGTAEHPEFSLINDDWANLSEAGYNNRIVPGFGDMDNDGMLDMVLGTDNGFIHWYKKNGPGYNDYALHEFQLKDVNEDPINVQSFASPILFDLNKDGLLDLVVGKRIGGIHYYENIGSANNPVFELVTDNLGKVDLSTANSPETLSILQFVEVNDTLHLFVGGRSGMIHYYSNIEDNINDGGEFTLLSETYANIHTGGFAAPAIAKIRDNDAFDLIVGGELGGLWAYTADPNSDPILSTDEFSIDENTTPKPIIFPNPTRNQTFTVNNLNESDQIEIFDISGKKISFEIINNNPESKTIQLPTVRTGLYFVKIIEAQRNAYQLKLLVE